MRTELDELSKDKVANTMVRKIFDVVCRLRRGSSLASGHVERLVRATGPA